jgi:hypothetical protein
MPGESRSSNVRILRFPSDRSLGWLSRFVSEEVSGEGSEYLAAARGAVVVPADAEIELEVDWNVRADLAPLSALQPDDLYSLQFRNVAMQPDELAYVQTLTGLRRLFCSETPIGDSGLAYVRALTCLETLWLHQAQVTDAGLTHVAAFSTLHTLALNGNPGVTDAGLAHLMGLTRLRWLFLSGTAVSQAGVDPLRKALPGCTISL